MIDRVNRIREKLVENGLDALLVCDPMSIRYLTGAFIMPMERMWMLLVYSDGKALLFANKLFVFEDTGIETVWHTDTDDSCKLLCDSLKGVKKLGVDKNLKARYLVPVIHSADEIQVTVSDIVDKMRLIKDRDELEKLRKASQINDQACARALSRLHDGMTEKELAAIVDEEYAALGASGCCFETIAAFGDHGADPHHMTDDTPLKAGDTVLLDMGCYYDGYCSDMTRTVFYGDMTEKQLEVFEIVKEAADRAKALVKPGVRFCDIDAAARDYITEKGYGEYFTHRLGHCIGTEDHEPEDVSSANEHPVRPGMVFSIEPGIYLPGEFGVRLEDLVTVTEDGCEVLNFLPMEPSMHRHR